MSRFTLVRTTGGAKVPLIRMGRPLEKPHFWGEFTFGHIDFEMCMGHTGRDVKWRVGCICLELQRPGGDINEAANGRSLVYKTIELAKVMWGEAVGRKKPWP